MELFASRKKLFVYRRNPSDFTFWLSGPVVGPYHFGDVGRCGFGRTLNKRVSVSCTTAYVFKGKATCILGVSPGKQQIPFNCVWTTCSPTISGKRIAIANPCTRCKHRDVYGNNRRWPLSRCCSAGTAQINVIDSNVLRQPFRMTAVYYRRHTASVGLINRTSCAA